MKPGADVINNFKRSVPGADVINNFKHSVITLCSIKTVSLVRTNQVTCSIQSECSISP